MGRWASAAVGLLVLAGCGTADAEPTPATPPTTDRPALRVLFVGDSLAEGYFASTPDRAFPELLVAGWSESADVTDLRATRAGWRTFRIATLVDQTGLDVAVLEAGANDVGETSVPAFARAYRDLLARVESGSPDVVVVCLGPWGPPGVTDPYDAAVEAACDGEAHRFALLSDLYAHPGLRGPVGSETTLGDRDDYHPNDRGHAAIAARVREALD